MIYGLWMRLQLQLRIKLLQGKMAAENGTTSRVLTLNSDVFRTVLDRV